MTSPSADDGTGRSGPPTPRSLPEPGRRYVEAVFPLTAPVVDAGRIHVIDLEGGPAVQTLHVGSYDGLHGAYAALERWLQDQGATPGGPVREVYLTGPDVPQDQQQTLIVQAVAAG